MSRPARACTVCLLLGALLGGCIAPPPSPSRSEVPEAAPLPFVLVAEDASGFVLDTGEPFVPWGFNYHNADFGQLIEDYWAYESTWPTTAADFEPVVPGKPSEGWLRGEGLDNLFFVQHITRDRVGRAWPNVMRAWIGTLTDAIRRHDDRHLVTVGFLPLAGFAQFARDLDFLSVHVYPAEGAVGESIDMVARYADAGVPVVVEETFPLNVGVEGEEQFILGTRGMADGVIGFYWGATPEELGSSSHTGDALMRAWLELFVKLKPPPS